MSDKASRTLTRIDPEISWTVVTDSPLKGMVLAHEAGTILAWDEGNQLYLLDTQGESLSSSRVPNKILAGAISDEGSLIALLVEAEDAGLLLLDADFEWNRSGPRRRRRRSSRSTRTADTWRSARDKVLSIWSIAMAGRPAAWRRWSRFRIFSSCPTGRWRSGPRRSGCWWASPWNRRGEESDSRPRSSGRTA